MKDRPIEIFWRPAYEVYSAITWALATFISILIGIYASSGINFIYISTIPMFFFMLLRIKQTFSVLNKRARLFSLPEYKLSLEQLISTQKKNPKQVLYGKGFYWEQSHAQKLYDFNSRSRSSMMPPDYYMSLRKYIGLDSTAPNKGTPFTHGINKTEQDIFGDLPDRFSHRSVSGTSGAGKGRVLSLDVIQAIVRQESVILIDPKKDENLLDLIHATLCLLGQKNRLYFFSPSHPSSSCRINPLKNFNETAQLASRIVELMPGGGDSESFKAFAWRAVNTIFEGMMMISDTPTLVKLRQYIEGDIDFIISKVAKHFFSSDKKYTSALRTITDESDYKKQAAFFVNYYESNVKNTSPNKTIEALVSVHKHDKAHFAKLIANIIPILNMLTQGSMSDLLSPSYDENDPRPVVDLATIAEKGDVLVVQTGSLSDPNVGNAIGSLILSDIVNVVSDRYFYLDNDSLIPLNIYGDESSDYVNTSAIRVANKSRGSDTAFQFYFQTTSDLEEKLQSKPASRMMLGNANTNTALRALDDETMTFFSEKFGETSIKTISHGHTTQSTSPKEGMDYNTGYNKMIAEAAAPFVATDSLAGLMDLHHFTSFPGGLLAKIRVPYIQVPKGLNLVPTPFDDDPFGSLPSINKDIPKSNNLKMSL